MKETCFVIMGFGKKTDYPSGRTLDLDKTYKNIIKPVVEKLGYRCIRSDEIQHSGIIDKSMYALLVRAELVIADISTLNPNALYELGIRHAVKPSSTIVLKEDGGGKIPFDLDHTRIFPYKHLGEDIGVDDANDAKENLEEWIINIKETPTVDSPMYEYIEATPPRISDEEFQKIVKELAGKGEHIFAITDQAKALMKSGNFKESSEMWKKASELAPNESYFVQQHALSRYKSKEPDEHKALTNALEIIKNIYNNGDTNDPETLGITGAINRRLYQSTKNEEYLEHAIKAYEKGFKVRADYYNGENYAFCLNLKADIETDSNEKIYWEMEAKKTREKIIETLENISKIDLESIKISF